MTAAHVAGGAVRAPARLLLGPAHHAHQAHPAHQVPAPVRTTYAYILVLIRYRLSINVMVVGSIPT